MVTSLIPLSGCETIEFVPPQVAEQFPDETAERPTFFLRVPTFSIRDKIAAILMQRGLIPTTMAQSRAILVDALYDLYDEPTADDNAAFLESYWTRQEVHEELVNAWQIREAQRIFDKGMGVRKELPQEPIPEAPFTMREQSRQASIVTHVLESHDRYRAYQARYMVQAEEEEEMVTRLFLDGWKNCHDRDGQGAPVVKEIKPERDEQDRLTLDCIERLRQWLSDSGFPDAFDQVKQAVRNQFGAPRGLEKNFDLPLDTSFNPSGSQTSSGNLENNGGSSTTSSITPTPDTKSTETSVASRNSRSVSRGSKSRKSRGKRSGRTAAVS